MKTLEPRNFLGKPPPYAIHSHPWGEEEVTFKDFANKTTRTTLKGWSKVVNCCRIAATDEWEWVWIDTCCIDKSDNSELSEVNSMFCFYEDTLICYAYLADVPCRSPGVVPMEQSRPRVPTNLDQDSDSDLGDTLFLPWAMVLENSRWFRRGWTL